MRMSMRWFARLPGVFSMKARNLEAAAALHFMGYEFCRFHRSTRARNTPTMTSGVAKKPWQIEDVVNLSVKAEN
jgi:hypothetical protein